MEAEQEVDSVNKIIKPHSNQHWLIVNQIGWVGGVGGKLVELGYITGSSSHNNSASLFYFRGH